jgi:nucleoside-diphosphate-sugar epimerase
MLFREREFFGRPCDWSARRVRSSKTDVFNICTGKSMSINCLAYLVCRVLGKNLEVLHVKPGAGDILHNYGDPAKAQGLSGFKAQVSLEEGLKLFVEVSNISV